MLECYCGYVNLRRDIPRLRTIDSLNISRVERCPCSCTPTVYVFNVPAVLALKGGRAYKAIILAKKFSATCNMRLNSAVTDL